LDLKCGAANASKAGVVLLGLLALSCRLVRHIALLLLRRLPATALLLPALLLLLPVLLGVLLKEVHVIIVVFLLINPDGLGGKLPHHASRNRHKHAVDPVALIAYLPSNDQHVDYCHRANDAALHGEDEQLHVVHSLGVGNHNLELLVHGVVVAINHAHRDVVRHPVELCCV